MFGPTDTAETVVNAEHVNTGANTGSFIALSRFVRVLQIIARAPTVHQDVRANYWNNRWWPTEITDWRLKVLFVGLSTRISYNAIDTYQAVRDRLAAFGYDGLLTLPEVGFRRIVTPLGLDDSRWRFWQSLQEFALQFPDSEKEPDRLKRQSNDELIEFLRSEIQGVGYKVAQGAALYIRGYHSGIIPVDSGMKDLLGPCLGFQTAKGPKGHELMRKHLEFLAQRIDYQQLLTVTGYQDILNEMDAGQVNTWWVHLVLIYYKRRYCNLHNMSLCPLVADPTLRTRMRFTCMAKRE